VFYASAAFTLKDFGFKKTENYFLNHLRIYSIEDSLNS